MAKFGRPVTSGFSAGAGNVHYTRLSPSAVPMARYWQIGDPAGVKTPSAGPTFQAAWAADSTRTIMPGGWV